MKSKEKFEKSFFFFFCKSLENRSLKVMESGVHGEIRTHDLKIRNFALYPAELRGQIEKSPSL